MNCPRCHSNTVVKNGIRPLTGCQQYRCQDCQRQFVANPKKPRVSLWQKTMIGRLLLERIHLAGIARVVGVSERWSFVGNKGNKQWVWLTRDRKIRAIVGVHVGDRCQAGAQALWDSLPEAYRESAICYTDYWEAYAKVFLEDRHVAAGKDSGLTNHLERFNNTLRHRVSRLVRQSLAFSKKLDNHIGAIWLFVHHYN